MHRNGTEIDSIERLESATDSRLVCTAQQLAEEYFQTELGNGIQRITCTTSLSLDACSLPKGNTINLHQFSKAFSKRLKELEAKLINGFYSTQNVTQLNSLLEQARELGFKRGEKGLPRSEIAQARKELALSKQEFLDTQATKHLCKRHPEVKALILQQVVKAERHGQQQYIEAYHHALTIRQGLKSGYPTELQNFLLDLDLASRRRAVNVYEQVFKQPFLDSVVSYFDCRLKGIWRFVPFLEPLQKIRRVKNALIGICSNRLGIDVGLVNVVEDSAKDIFQFAKRNIIGKSFSVTKVFLKYSFLLIKSFIYPQKPILSWNPTRIILNCVEHVNDCLASAAKAMHKDLTQIFPRLAKLGEILLSEAKKSLATAAAHPNILTRHVVLLKAIRKQTTDLLDQASDEISNKHRERFKDLLEDDRTEAIAASLYVRISGSSFNKRTSLENLSGTIRQISCSKEEKEKIKTIFATQYAPIFGTKSLEDTFRLFLSPQVADYLNATLSDSTLKAEKITASLLDSIINGNEASFLKIIDNIECACNPKSKNYDPDLISSIQTRLQSRYNIDCQNISKEPTFHKLDPKLLLSLGELLKGNYLEAAYLRLSLTEPITWKRPLLKLATFASPTYKRQQYQKLVEVFIETGPYSAKDLLDYYDRREATKKSKNITPETGVFLNRLQRHSNRNYALIVKELISNGKLDEASLIFHALNGWTKDVDTIKLILANKSKEEIKKLSQVYSGRFTDSQGSTGNLEQDLRNNINGYNLVDILKYLSGNEPKSLRQIHLDFTQAVQDEGVTWFHRKLIGIPKALQILRVVFAKQEASFYQQVLKDIQAAEEFFTENLTRKQGKYPPHLIRRYEVLTSVAMEGLKVLRKDRETLGATVANLASLSTGGGFAALVAIHPTLIAHPLALATTALVFGSVNACARMFAGRIIKGRHYEWNDRWLDIAIGYTEAPLFAFSQSIKGIQFLAQLSPTYSPLIRYVFPQAFKVAFKTKFLGYGKRVHFSRYSHEKSFINSGDQRFPGREMIESIVKKDQGQRVEAFKIKLLRKLVKLQSKAA